MKQINLNKQNLENGKTYRKITIIERIITVHDNQTRTTQKFYALFLGLGIIFTIFMSPTIVFDVPNFPSLLLNWFILIIVVELTMLFFASIILFMMWLLDDKTLKWITLKKKSYKKSVNYELLEE